MKKLLQNPMLVLMAVIVLTSVLIPTGVKSQNISTKANSYVLIAWNDLGMHCANKYFNNFCVLPPYNNQHAQLVLVGDVSNSPQVLTTGYHTTYEIPGNTYSVGKTDFWTYVNSLFGASLANNVGLTGVGLTGNFLKTSNYFHVEGIPVTPYTDADLVNEHPYQLAFIKAYDTSNNLLTTTQSVIPVSNELSCISSGCHTSEAQILSLHPTVSGFNPANTPIMCANCHKDNALGMAGVAGIPAFSQAMHQFHGDETNDCYKCHPGPNTQCFRDIMHTGGMTCQDCHGSVTNVGNTIENGREAWLQEPDCGATACHGSTYASETGKLFRNSQGHGGMFCSACHGSPHAILPTVQANDNIQNIALQGYAGTLNKCSVCHGVAPTGAGPHGLYASEMEYDAALHNETLLRDISPNPVSETATIGFMLDKNAKVTLQVYNQMGQRVRLLMDKHLNQGSYNVSLNTSNLPAGTYFYTMMVDGRSYSKKMLVVR